jgi:hypothetical protein
MQNYNNQQLNSIISNISDQLKTNSNITIYLTALLFAIGLNIKWLIITFSVLFGISLLIFINKKTGFIQIKK